jgi:Mg-chelatase subunit ChlD
MGVTMYHAQTTQTALVPGSLAAIAADTNTSIAESFLSADALIVVDVSGSMSGSPYDQACAELRKLQADLPGKVAVVAFSDRPEFAAHGTPRMIGGGTDLARALTFVHVADDCEIRFIVISDGCPNDEAAALREARKFQSRIDTVFIGREGEPGQDFLRRLAAASGGQHSTNQVHQIAERVERLLLTSSPAH